MATPEALVELCKGGEVHARIVSGALPSDAKVVGCGIDHATGGVAIVVESESFAPVEVGLHLPVLPLPAFERMTLYTVTVPNA